MNRAQDVPANGIRGQKVTEEMSNDAETVRLISVNGIVVLGEGVLEEVLPHAVELAQTLSDQAEELVVGALLRAALDNHRGHFFLQTGWKIDAQQFVGAFFEATRRHDGQVNCSAKVDEIRVGGVLDLHLSLLNFLLVISARDV